MFSTFLRCYEMVLTCLVVDSCKRDTRILLLWRISSRRRLSRSWYVRPPATVAVLTNVVPCSTTSHGSYDRVMKR